MKFHSLIVGILSVASGTTISADSSIFYRFKLSGSIPDGVSDGVFDSVGATNSGLVLFFPILMEHVMSLKFAAFSIGFPLNSTS